MVDNVEPWDFGEGTDDDDAEFSRPEYMPTKDAVLFLVNVSSTMLNNKGENTVLVALECAKEFLLQKIISGPYDKVGILLYGTKLTGNVDEESFKHHYLLLDLDQPDAERIKELRSLLPENINGLPSEFLRSLCTPTDDFIPFSNTLFLVNHLFQKNAPNFNSKRVFLITDNDDPLKDHPEETQIAITKANDLNDIGVIIDPLFVSFDGNFDVDKFYSNIIFQGRDHTERDDDQTIITDVSNGIEQFTSVIKAREVPRRSLFHIYFELGPGFAIDVKGYLLSKRQSIQRSHLVSLKGGHPKIASIKTEYIDNTTTKILKREEMKKGYFVGSNREEITFTMDEIKGLRAFENPVLRLLGFKPMTHLANWQNIKQSYFIYPSESRVTGSTRVFASLHKRMLLDNVFALVWFVPRKDTSPLLCALVAESEEIDDKSGIQSSPAGCYIIQLPSADDIRLNPGVDEPRANEKLTDCMSRIVKSMILGHKYDPSKFPNPSLQWHYKVLESVALEEELPQTPIDKTIPQYGAIQKRASEAIIKWGDVLQIAINDPALPSMIREAQKRTIIKEETQASLKRAKVEPNPEQDEMVYRYYKEGRLSSLSVSELRLFISRHGNIPIGLHSMKKAQCLDIAEMLIKSNI